jgi:hypothetical protein
MPRCQRDGSLHSRLSRPEPLFFLSSSSPIVLTRLSRPRSRHTTSHKIWWRRESNPDPWICSQELCPLDHSGLLGIRAGKQRRWTTNYRWSHDTLQGCSARRDIRYYFIDAFFLWVLTIVFFSLGKISFAYAILHRREYLYAISQCI